LVGQTDLLVALGFTAVALLLRMPGLGRYDLATDEYYFLQSVLTILREGVPAFPEGGYYVRGILIQYLSAIPVGIAGGATATTASGLEGPARLVPLFLGSATVGLFYLLCRRFLGRTASVATALVLALSSWQVEFSRFARMYAGFQLVFVGFVMALHAGYWRLGLRRDPLAPEEQWRRRRARLAAVLLAVLCVFVHAGAIFLPPLIVVAGLSAERLTRRSASWLLGLPVLVLGMNVALALLDLRDLGAANALPPGIPDFDAGSRVRLPDLQLGALAHAPLFIVGLLGAAGLGFRAYRRTVRDCDRPATHGLAALLLLAPLLHQMGLLLAGWVILAAASPPAARAVFHRWRQWVPPLALASATWLFVLAIAARAEAPDAGRLVLLAEGTKRLILNLPFHSAIAIPFAEQVPRFGILALGAIVLAGLRVLTGPDADRDRFPILVVTASLLMLAFIRVQYDTTRYAYFLFPMVILLIGIELTRPAGALARRGAPAALVGVVSFLPLAATAITEEIDLGHLRRIDSPASNYRTREFRSRANHWYLRADFRGPAREASRRAGPRDVVVVEPPASRLYLDRPFLPYVGDERPRYRNVARHEGTREIWTGRRLLHSPEMLFDAVPPAGEGDLWFVAAVHDLAGSFSEGVDLVALAASAGLEAEIVYTGQDARVGVWRIRRLPDREASPPGT
jgi:hypothetical protein